MNSESSNTSKNIANIHSNPKKEEKSALNAIEIQNIKQKIGATNQVKSIKIARISFQVD